MAFFKENIINRLAYAETLLDKFTFNLRKRWDKINPVDIVPYRGYGTAQSLFLRGRVLEDKGIVTTDRDGKWQNLKNAYHRFQSDEIPGVRLNVQYFNNKVELLSDEEGYFEMPAVLKHPVSRMDNAETWHQATIQVADALMDTSKIPNVRADILVPPLEAEYGVISDLDDTVIRTDVISKSKMLYNTFFKNAYSRMPFEGVAALYHALRRGHDGTGQNPLFYVSNSPWNLYDMLIDFMDIHHIPIGPVLLRDFGLSARDPLLEVKEHKYTEILRIMLTYPHLPFILIGDSGEKDTDIYQEIAHTLPGRVKAIYIRCVDDPKRANRIHNLAASEDYVDIQVVTNSLEAAQHAALNGWITPAAMANVAYSMGRGV